MTHNFDSIQEILFGEDSRLGNRFLVLAGCFYVFIVGLSFLTGDQFREMVYSFRYTNGVLAVGIVGLCAWQTYQNLGLLQDMVMAYIVLVGVVLAGVVPVAPIGSESSVYLFAVLPMGFAVVLSVVGFMLGFSIRAINP